MKPIHFVDLITPHQLIKNEYFEKLNIAYDNAIFSSSTYNEELENEFALYNKSKFAVAVNNGTSAIHLALLTLGIKENDEVIVPTNTYIGSIWGILYLKAKPVLVDCDNTTYTIDVSKIEEKITTKTKAIIGVHLYGQACELDSLMSICNKYTIPLIEDASQAHGAMYHDKRVGNFGAINCFSLYPSKNLGTCGEGGIITTHNEEYYHLLKAHSNQGQFKKYEHDILGFNYRMGSLEAIATTIKIKYLDEWNEKRRTVAQKYLEGIKNNQIRLPSVNTKNQHVFHLFVIQTSKRNKLIEYLNQHQIPTQIHYPIPCHLQKALATYNYKIGDFPVAEHHSSVCLSLPMHPFLDDEQINYIIDIINQYE